MNWRHYQNELIVLGSLLLMISMYFYKQSAIDSQSVEFNRATQSIEEMNEVIALKKVWTDKNINKKIEKVKALISPSKVKWSNKNRKVVARYTGLKPSEVNKLVTKILNTPILIDKLDIQKVDSSYNMEFKCRW